MRPSERLAALKALEHGLSAAIKRAKAEVEYVREQTGAKSFDTELGTVTVAVSEPRLILPDGPLIEWAESHGMSYEVETVKRIRPTLRETLARRFVIDGDQVIDSETGEVVEWAQVSQGTETVRVVVKPEAKQWATQVAADQLPALLEVER